MMCMTLMKKMLVASSSVCVLPLVAQALTFLPALLGASELTIEKIEPTPLFPRPVEGQPIRQLVLLHVSNTGKPIPAVARITVGSEAARVEDLGELPEGKAARDIHIDDISQPADAIVEILPRGGGGVLAARMESWQPQKKWRIFCVSYSHHDLGFGNYPHRLRTEIRHANIERPLQFCAETDAWDEDSKFRFVIETSEPITSFLGSHGEADAAELARRIREGRIQLGAIHNTANTEQLSQELMARLFYLSLRHTPDLLSVPVGKTAQIDDVIGLTWPLATFCAEAGVPYFFHGYNGCGGCLKPAEAEPVFYWQGPAGSAGRKVLMRSTPYGGYMGDSLGEGNRARILDAVARLGAGWPYDALLLQDGTDFQLVTLDNARKIRAWNAEYLHPRLISATLDMFFDAIAQQADPSRIKTFAKDSNNQWADQDATDAWLLGIARRQGEAIPTAEKLSTIACALAGGEFPWTEIYQAYHRLLAYHEHTNAIDFVSPERERMQQYETELEENREMVTEAREFCDRVRESALEKIAGLIETRSERSVIVFNPLPRVRTDVVRFKGSELGGNLSILDADTRRTVPHQELEDGTIAFLASDVPAMGYRSFSILPTERALAPAQPLAGPALESRFYRVVFDPSTGAVRSLWDKELDLELVDPSAPYALGEYLYERYESASPAQGSRWHRVDSARLEAARGPVADVMTATVRAVGVEALRQTTILYHDIQRIDFVWDMVKSPSGRVARMPNTSVLHKESAYAALPFAVPDFRCRHELPGCVVEPIADQFQGSCTAFYAARHFADVSNDRFGVTVSSPDAALIEYGRPRSCAIVGGRESEFERVMEPPKSSHVFLYLLDNMFDVNIRWDQRGPLRFAWSVRSHAGDWRKGQADTFGWDVLNPLTAKLASGRRKGSLPGASSFLAVDATNVVSTTVKPAEANGAGFILRFHETQGRETRATASVRFLKKIDVAVETDLVENDRGIPLQVSGDNCVTFTIGPFGVKTLRVLSGTGGPPPRVAKLQAAPASDMEVDLEWELEPSALERPTHFRVYRGTKADFQPSLLNLVGRASGCRWRDSPRLEHGGWINNRLEPRTTYYYAISAVDRWNNAGPCSPRAAATTLDSSEKNMVPHEVEGLRAILVSPVSPQNYVNLLFRTSCESDVKSYEIHRSTKSGFVPDESTRIAVASADGIVKGSTAYGHVPRDYRMGDYDHMMAQDDDVEPSSTYYYRVRAVDAAGEKGPFSREASVRTKPPAPPTAKASASSIYAPEYGPERAVDGSPDPHAAWISKPHGGGTAAKPSDAWLVVEFPHAVTIRGLSIVGDDRPVIPLQRALRIESLHAAEWKTVAEVRDAGQKTIRVRWPEVLATGALRILVPAADLPRSTLPDIPDGVVRICEILLFLDDGREVAVPDLF